MSSDDDYEDQGRSYSFVKSIKNGNAELKIFECMEKSSNEEFTRTGIFLSCNGSDAWERNIGTQGLTQNFHRVHQPTVDHVNAFFKEIEEIKIKNDKDQEVSLVEYLNDNEDVKISGVGYGVFGGVAQMLIEKLGRDNRDNRSSISIASPDFCGQGAFTNKLQKKVPTLNIQYQHDIACGNAGIADKTVATRIYKPTTIPVLFKISDPSITNFNGHNPTEYYTDLEYVSNGLRNSILIREQFENISKKINVK
jgi:hypothetical protein